MIQHLTLRVKRFILEAHEKVCFYCSSPATHVDHIVPRRAGGTDDLTNLIAACRWCNLRKGGWELPDVRLHKALAAASAVEPAIRQREDFAVQKDLTQKARMGAMKEVQLAVRVTGGMQAALKQAAAETGRSAAGYMVFAIAKKLREDGFVIAEAEPARPVSTAGKGRK